VDWEGRGGGPAEGDGSEGIKDTVINSYIPTLIELFYTHRD